MNAAIIEAVLNVILSLAGQVIKSNEIDNIITILEGWVPTIVSEFSDLLPLVENIIATLKGSNVLTADQVATIDALNTSADAEFDAAVASKGTN